VTGSTATS